MNIVDAINRKKLGNIAVLFGGESSEREVSLNSGKAVVEAFKALNIDVLAVDVQMKSLHSVLLQENIKHCFIALHGGSGEDGTVQALLASLGITYTGSNLLGCAIAMDKEKTKLLWAGAGISTANFVTVAADDNWASVSRAVGNKFMIKPANEGSSIGMSIVDDAVSFNLAIEKTKQFDSAVIAERWIDGPEYTVAILAGEALPIIGMKTEHDFYDYDAKYQSADTQYICPCGLNEEVENSIKEKAVEAFNVLACSGWGRVDVMIDADKQFYFLEANTVPGMTSHSLVPMAAKAVGKTFETLVAEILLLSLPVEKQGAAS
ncbi:MAG: D-alanine--D-alanine ligase [Sinobacterium sp.]|nr:D-alanine--D-alanine ligase [Sinobacterium sp.]